MSSDRTRLDVRVEKTTDDRSWMALVSMPGLCNDDVGGVGQTIPDALEDLAEQIRWWAVRRAMEPIMVAALSAESEATDV